MHANEELIARFYTAFQNHDGAAMAACYHPDARFSDPVFPDLRGPRPGLMWRMLTEKAAELRLEFRDVHADDKAGSAHWEAWYPFTLTGRKVHNIIDASFEFRDGKISRHTDHFDFHRWAGQALGTPGKLLGWTPFLRNKVRAMAARNLAAYEVASRAKS